jgi:hypothetical protein
MFAAKMEIPETAFCGRMLNPERRSAAETENSVGAGQRAPSSNPMPFQITNRILISCLYTTPTHIYNALIGLSRGEQYHDNDHACTQLAPTYRPDHRPQSCPDMATPTYLLPHHATLSSSHRWPPHHRPATPRAAPRLRAYPPRASSPSRSPTHWAPRAHLPHSRSALATTAAATPSPLPSTLAQAFSPSLQRPPATRAWARQ